MPSPPPQPPTPLHLARLAQTTPGQPIALPGAATSVLWLTHEQALPGAASVLCLQGEALLDLVGGNFVRLQAGELYAIPPQTSAVPVQETALLLLLG